jgi:hypothetical protein
MFWLSGEIFKAIITYKDILYNYNIRYCIQYYHFFFSNIFINNGILTGHCWTFFSMTSNIAIRTCTCTTSLSRMIKRFTVLVYQKIVFIEMGNGFQTPAIDVIFVIVKMALYLVLLVTVHWFPVLTLLLDSVVLNVETVSMMGN